MLRRNRVFFLSIVFAGLSTPLHPQNVHADVTDTAVSLPVEWSAKQVERYQQLQALNADVNTRLDTGESHVAVKLAKKARRLTQKLYGRRDAENISALMLLARAYAADKDYSDARESLGEADSIAKTLYGDISGQRVSVLHAMADAEIRDSSAIELHESAVNIARQSYSPSDPELGLSLLRLGRRLLSVGLWRESTVHLQAADTIFTETLSDNDWRRSQASLLHALVLSRAGAPTDDELQQLIPLLDARPDEYSKRYLPQLKELGRATAYEETSGVLMLREKISVLSGEPYRAMPILIKPAAPSYPTQALNNGITGFVDFRFTISTQGRPIDIVVTGGDNSDIFAEAATKALRRFEYEIKVVDGVPTETTGIETRMRFSLGE